MIKQTTRIVYIANKHMRQGMTFYSYFMPVCSIVNPITLRCNGRPDALFHKAKGTGTKRLQ